MAKSFTVTVTRETPEGDEITINVESDGRQVFGAWIDGVDGEVELTDTERELAGMEASDAAKSDADDTEAAAESAWELENDR